MGDLLAYFGLYKVKTNWEYDQHEDDTYKPLVQQQEQQK